MAELPFVLPRYYCQISISEQNTLQTQKGTQGVFTWRRRVNPKLFDAHQVTCIMWVAPIVYRWNACSVFNLHSVNIGWQFAENWGHGVLQGYPMVFCFTFEYLASWDCFHCALWETRCVQYIYILMPGFSWLYHVLSLWTGSCHFQIAVRQPGPNNAPCCCGDEHEEGHAAGAVVQHSAPDEFSIGLYLSHRRAHDVEGEDI